MSNPYTGGPFTPPGFVLRYRDFTSLESAARFVKRERAKGNWVSPRSPFRNVLGTRRWHVAYAPGGPMKKFLQRRR